MIGRMAWMLAGLIAMLLLLDRYERHSGNSAWKRDVRAILKRQRRGEPF